MTEKEITKGKPMYTHHGKKRNQGRPITVGGKKALAYFEGDEVVGYTTLDEINKAFYTKDLPEYMLDF